MPEHLLKFYILGYFDGDGCIHNRKQSQNMVVHIVRTEMFVKGLQAFLPFETFVHQRTGKSVWFLGIYKLETIRQFRDWLYQDANIFLKRKKDIFFTDLSAYERTIVPCPECHGLNTNSKGKNTAGRHRVNCKDCKRSYIIKNQT